MWHIFCGIGLDAAQTDQKQTAHQQNKLFHRLAFSDTGYGCSYAYICGFGRNSRIPQEALFLRPEVLYIFVQTHHARRFDMRATFLTIAFTVLIAFSTPLQAEDYNNLLDLPEGTTLITLSAEQRTEIEQDLLIATLRYEAENRDVSALQNDINKVMSKALEKAQDVETVKAATQQYRVHQYDRNRGKDTRRDMIWRGQQSLQLKGKKADDLLELTGALQEMGLALSGLTYTVSPGLMDQTRDALMETVLQKLADKAGRAARALGKTETELLHVNINADGYHPPIPRNMAFESAGVASMQAAPPVAAPEETSVTLKVTAQALLK